MLIFWHHFSPSEQLTVGLLLLVCTLSHCLPSYLATSKLRGEKRKEKKSWWPSRTSHSPHSKAKCLLVHTYIVGFLLGTTASWPLSYLFAQLTWEGNPISLSFRYTILPPLALANVEKCDLSWRILHEEDMADTVVHARRRRCREKQSTFFFCRRSGWLDTHGQHLRPSQQMVQYFWASLPVPYFAAQWKEESMKKKWDRAAATVWREKSLWQLAVVTKRREKENFRGNILGGTFCRKLQTAQKKKRGRNIDNFSNTIVQWECDMF